VAALSVSVIIPTYNRAALLPRAVGSALRSLEPGDEVIVVDDGSTDDTEAALRPVRDRIRLVRLPHGGAGRARNRGVARATGSLVAFLDSDDEWMPDKLRLQRTLLEQRPDVVFSFSDFAIRREGREDRHRGLAGWRDDARSWDEILGGGRPYSTFARLPAGRHDCPVHVGDLYPELVGTDLVLTATLVVNRAAAGEALRFPEDLPTYEDLECGIRLARAGPAAYIDCETTWQWSHGGTRLSSVDRATWAAARLAIVERTYGRDTAFMAAHPRRVEAACARLHLVRARWFLGRGDTRAARDELRRAGGGPVGYRILARLPGWRPPWLRRAVRTARAVRHGIRSSRQRRSPP
jgi:glycosyltransferase involved in cell wall biosynthesis